MTEDGRTDRARGAVLGVHAGDALGATLEFLPARECRLRHPDGLRDIVGGGPFGWAPGAPTDDTDLTWALARGYLDTGFGSTAEVVRAAADHMLVWYTRGPKDIGNATRSALARYRSTGDPTTSGQTSDDSQANGSLMRTMPVAVAHLDDPDRRAADARALSAVTHAHPVCLDACVVYCDLAAALITGTTPADAVAAALARPGLSAEVVEAVTGAADAPPGGGLALDELPGHRGGYVLWALRLAVRVVVAAPDVESGLVPVVMLGDDADTNGAIAGGLLGARFGRSAIPRRWLDQLALGPDLDRFATAAVAHGQAGG